MADDSNWRRQLLRGRILSAIALPFLLAGFVLAYPPGERHFGPLAGGLCGIGLVFVFAGANDIRDAIKKKKLQ